MKIAFATLGCRVNQYETQLLKTLFLKQNFEIVDCFDFADVYVLNSCTVTSTSDAKLRHLSSRFKRINLNAVLVLVGCFAQAFSNEVTLFEKFDIVLGNVNKFCLPEFLDKFLMNRQRIVSIVEHRRNDSFLNLTISDFSHRFRAFVKIEDGCNRRCSYCIIPFARGFVKSKTLDILKREVEQLAANNYIEIVLTGINLSSFGFDFDKKIRLIDAVKTVSEVKGVKRVRLSSLEPDLLSEEDLLELSQMDKFCPSFHLALQSGSNAVLKRMCRFYSVEFYEKLVDLIFKYFKNPSITTDIMVGFPQESEEEFQQTLNFVQKIGFLKVHIFPYSVRPNTAAAKMSGQVLAGVKKFRVNLLKKIALSSGAKFLENQQNKILQVLFEKEEVENVFVGYSKNYCLVKVKNSVDLCGQIKSVKITKSFETYCFGELV